MQSKSLTPEEAALLISSSKPPSTTTLWRWRRNGIGPEYLKIGAAVRYTPEAIEEFLVTCKVKRTELPAEACHSEQV